MISDTQETMESCEKQTPRIPLIGEVAPRFEGVMTQGPICFPEGCKGKWTVLGRLAEDDQGDYLRTKTWRTSKSPSRFGELRRAKKMGKWAARAKLPEFEVVGKVALSAEARKTRQGVRLWFTKPD